MPVLSLHGPPGKVPQCSVPKTELRPLMSSMMSISPEPGQPTPLRSGAPSIQNAGQYPAPLEVLTSGCWIDASIMTTPPGGAPNVAACVSNRPEVQPAPGSPPECRARSARCPAPSWNTLAVLLVIVSISPVPKLLPGPVSYFQTPVSRPVPAAPLKSSLHVRLKPAGGAGTAAGAEVPADAVRMMPTTPTTSTMAESPVMSRFRGDTVVLLTGS